MFVCFCDFLQNEIFLTIFICYINLHGKSIVVLATLDTKGHEAQFLREQIEKSGDKALVVLPQLQLF